MGNYGTFVSKFISTHLRTAFWDFLESSIALQVLPHCLKSKYECGLNPVGCSGYFDVSHLVGNFKKDFSAFPLFSIFLSKVPVLKKCFFWHLF